MSEIVLGEPLASQIRRTAEIEGIDVESLIAAAVRHYHFEAQRRKINVESEWWRATPPEMRQKYGGGFVAIHNKEVVDHDRDEEVLRKRIRSKYGKIAVLLTSTSGWRELQVVSTRLAPMRIE